MATNDKRQDDFSPSDSDKNKICLLQRTSNWKKRIHQASQAPPAKVSGHAMEVIILPLFSSVASKPSRDMFNWRDSSSFVETPW
ncbi:hypothetical protein CapIbe_018026 [Capra ibex]